MRPVDTWPPPEPYPSDVELDEVSGGFAAASADGDPSDEREWAEERAQNERVMGAAFAAERARRA